MIGLLLYHLLGWAQLGKPHVAFDITIYREIRCLIRLGESVDMTDLERRFQWDARLFGGPEHRITIPPSARTKPTVPLLQRLRTL